MICFLHLLYILIALFLACFFLRKPYNKKKLRAKYKQKATEPLAGTGFSDVWDGKEKLGLASSSSSSSGRGVIF